MVTLANPFTPEWFPVDKYNHLVLNRVKSVSASWHLWKLKGLSVTIFDSKLNIRVTQVAQ